MGIQGLLSYCLERREQCVEYIDLVDVALRENGIEILCDFYSFEHMLVRNFWKSLSGVSGNQFLRILGGEYKALDAYVTKLIKDLQSLGINLVMFVDGAKGSSKVGTTQKLETWKFRHEKDVDKIKDLLAVCYGHRRIEDLPDTTSVRPVLLEVQIFETLKACKCEIIQLSFGEADFVIARNLRLRSKAFAVISNDSDFCVFQQCRFIPNELFDLHKDLQLGEPQPLPEKPNRLLCGIIAAERVVSLLELHSIDELVELSIVNGNDFTGPHVRKIRGKLGFRGRTSITDYVNWVKEFRKVENHPAMEREMRCNRPLDNAVKLSRQFYSLTMPSDAADLKGPLTQFIDDNIQQGKYPSNIMGMHQNFYWHRMLLEDISPGHPCAEIALAGLRSYIYNMVLDRRENTVVEYGRSPEELLTSYPVYSCQERRIRTVDHMDATKKFQNLRTFHMAMVHLEPNFPTEWYKRYGWSNGCVCYCLRYFLVLNTGANLNITYEEFMPIVAMIYCQAEQPWYQALCLLPTVRCVTVANWFQDVYRHAFLFLGQLLNLSDEFPQPTQIFKGAVWTAFYMVSKHEAMLRGPAQFPAEYIEKIRKDMRGILSEKRHIIKYVVEGIYDFNPRF